MNEVSLNDIKQSVIESKDARIISFIKLTFAFLFIVCVFDPANQLLGLKYLFFYFIWLQYIFYRGITYNKMRFSSGLILYLVLFILVIPLLSISYYLFIDGDVQRFDGALYFKPYLFLAIVIVLYDLNIDLLKLVVIIFTFLSAVTIIFFLLSYFKIPFVFAILEISELNSMTTSGIRSFSGVEFLGVDFQSSPLITFSISYFAKKAICEKGRFKTVLLLILNIAAMFVGATRNNMFVSILLPFFVFIWYSRKKGLTLLIIGLILSFFIITNFDIIQGMFDSEEKSNNVKLTFYDDYMALFSNWGILLFGQGLGSFFNSTSRGYVSISELTYFEFIRRFGLILSVIIFGMLLLPLTKLLYKRYKQYHYIYIAYFFYLIICFSNPFLMSSTGMLLLSLVLYKTFQNKSKTHEYSQ